jgi:hypothetical protein
VLLPEFPLLWRPGCVSFGGDLVGSNSIRRSSRRAEERSRECHPETAECFSAPAPAFSQAPSPSGPEDDT